MTTIEPRLIVGWLAARSLARGLPPPVADQGGWRVDSGQAEEARRYVFTAPCDGLRALGQAIEAPWIALKLCGTNAELLALLPPRWGLTRDTDSVVMVRDEPPPPAEAPLPPGYRMVVEQNGAVTFASILNGDALAASGYAAGHDGVFVYDRIVTDPAHRRCGLGRALMTRLADGRRSPDSREILTATPAGRGLYEMMG